MVDKTTDVVNRDPQFFLTVGCETGDSHLPLAGPCSLTIAAARRAVGVNPLFRALGRLLEDLLSEPVQAAAPVGGIVAMAITCQNMGMLFVLRN